MSLKICLMIAALFWSVQMAQASELPICPGSPAIAIASRKSPTLYWTKCIGKQTCCGALFFYFKKTGVDEGEYLNGCLVDGTIARNYDSPSPTVERIYYGDQVRKNIKSWKNCAGGNTPSASAPTKTELHRQFTLFASTLRRNIQTVLSDLGFYKSSIDSQVSIY